MKKILVYSKDGCPQCDAAKGFLKSHGLEYNEVNISHDDEAKRNLIADGHRSVPQFYLDGKVLIDNGWHGLQKIDIESLKEKLGE